MYFVQLVSKRCDFNRYKIFAQLKQTLTCNTCNMLIIFMDFSVSYSKFFLTSSSNVYWFMHIHMHFKSNYFFVDGSVSKHLPPIYFFSFLINVTNVFKFLLIQITLFQHKFFLSIH